MNNNLRLIVFGAVMLLYLWYPYSMIRGQEEILREGTTYRFKPRPVDPVDAFRGRYIVLDYEGLEFDYSNAANAFKTGQEVYLSLAEDRQGFAYFKAIHQTPPATGDFISTFCNSIANDYIWLSPPDDMARYFLNEKIAPEAEALYNELNQRSIATDSVLVYVDTKVKDGEIRLEQLYMEDVPVEEYVRRLLQDSQVN